MRATTCSNRFVHEQGQSLVPGRFPYAFTKLEISRFSFLSSTALPVGNVVLDTAPFPQFSILEGSVNEKAATITLEISQVRLP